MEKTKPVALLIISRASDGILSARTYLNYDCIQQAHDALRKIEKDQGENEKIGTVYLVYNRTESFGCETVAEVCAPPPPKKFILKGTRF